MDSIIVTGNGPLSGRIPIAGAKNACLTLMPATLLSDEPLTLTNAPRLSDSVVGAHLTVVRITEDAEEDDDLMRNLDRLDLKPGATVEVVEMVLAGSINDQMARRPTLRRLRVEESQLPCCAIDSKRTDGCLFFVHRIEKLLVWVEREKRWTTCLDRQCRVG